MKRSKLFLGATAGLLAVVAFASAKAKHNTISVCYNTLGASKTPVCPDSQFSARTIHNVGAKQLTAVFGSQSYKLYTCKATETCGLPLYSE